MTMGSTGRAEIALIAKTGGEQAAEVAGATEHILPAVSRRRHGRGRLVNRALALADLAGLSIAFFASVLVSSEGTKFDSPRLALWTVLFLLTLPLWLLFAKSLGLYASDDSRADHSTADEALGVVNLVTLGTWVVFISAWATTLSHPQVSRIIAFWALAFVLVLVGRVIARAVTRRMADYVQNGVILGAGHVGQLLARKIQQHPEYGINLVGFVDEKPRARRVEVADVQVLGGLRDLPHVVASEGIDRVIVAFSAEPDTRTMEMLRMLRDHEVIVDTVPRLYELIGPRADVHLLEGLPLITVPPGRLPRASLVGKRLVDVVGATILLVLSSPFFVFAAYRIKRESPGPVFFRQSRLATNMRPFILLKFRTMRVEADESEHREYIKQTMSMSASIGSNGAYKLSRDADVTPFGRFLRRTSMDELPQLINVIRGDMSLVGPRPCIEYETENFEAHHFDRFLVPQGITGLWQVTARANSTFGEALEMDVAYVRGWSLGLDLRLIFRTPFALLRQRKATA
jgi:exopolysaccharide biosynthesis polyprenyl glycosylphosphotransferase